MIIGAFSRFALAFLIGVFLAAADPQQSAEDQALFGDLPRVEAASLHSQTLADAPANVTMITAADILHYGYRTLAEALASVRGFYVTYDHLYHSVGVSGISIPGDFNTRFLVMLNGHPLTDNIYDSNNFFGQDFGLDMDLVERIEIIRGPTSALYGSNGMLANINVVTRSPVDGEKLRASVETGSFGERKLSLSSAAYLGHGANLLIAASAFNNSGSGIADRERGYHTFANMIWRNWSFIAYFNSRDKQPAVGLGTSLSADPGQHAVDGRSLVGATYKRTLGGAELRWQLFYDRYRYHDRYDYPADDAGSYEALYDFNRGDTLDSQLTYARPIAKLGTFTAGLQGSWDLRAEQYNVSGGVVADYANHPDRDAALFAQQEWSLVPRWTLYGGLRVDLTRNFGNLLSPRVALVYRASARTAYKFVYGRPFRNPSAFEQFYNDGGLSYAAAPPLHQETAHTLQASVERQVARNWAVTLVGFDYYIAGVIEAAFLDGGVQQYRNAGKIHSSGAEAELSGKLWGRVETSASAAWQLAHGSRTPGWLPNSPRVVSKARAGVPLFRERLFLSTSLQYVSARAVWSGDRLGGAALVDSVASVRLHPRYELLAGVRNALDRRYEDPIYATVDRLRGDGRSVFLELVWRPWE